MSNDNSEISRALMDIVWHFGPKGLNGECCENLSMPEFLALDKISNTKHCPVQDIGTALGFTKSGATRIVNRLEKKGYVEKKKSYDDARICCVVITQRGGEILDTANARYSEEYKKVIAQLPKELGSIIEQSLKAMAGALNK
ncbi:MAG: MarR family transcriptional regulator [Desulfobacteraceae bacterium]|nr:MAG: MarR family transcriptional regulator [Desulfobacteraceae bacterium]